MSNFLDDNNNYVKTDWGYDENMTKIEDALEYALDNNVIEKIPVNDVISLEIAKKQHSTITSNTTIILPDLKYNYQMTYYLECRNDVYVSFHTDSDNQMIELRNGCYAIELNYFGDWIIKC